METTREERQKVYEGLRDASNITARFSIEDILPALVSICGINFDGSHTLWMDTMKKLADLIEPQEIDEDTSDGYHTFKQLYFQRMMLFVVLVNEHKELAWKTHCHEDGKLCFGGGWFLVTIDTPAGPYGYHYEDEYWDLFDCEGLPKAKHWDGYDESDVVRLMSLVSIDQQERTCHATDTSEERIEVAKQLRDYSHALSSDTCDEFYTLLNMALFGDSGLARPDSGIFKYLAELIDPKCEMANASLNSGFGRGGCTCSACGAYIEYEAGSINYCPYCGARVVLAKPVNKC